MNITARETVAEKIRLGSQKTWGLNGNVWASDFNRGHKLEPRLMPAVVNPTFLSPLFKSGAIPYVC